MTGGQTLHGRTALVTGGAAGARQGILSLVVKDKAALYNAYMPYLRNGGIFVPTPRRYFIGDEVFLLLTLPESNERLPVAGKVVWVTPTGAQGARTAGGGRMTPDSVIATASVQMSSFRSLALRIIVKFINCPSLFQI